MSLPYSLDYTLVVGVDAKHLDQLEMVWRSWSKNKPSLLEHPMLVFFDQESTTAEAVADVLIDHPNLTIVAWPPPNVSYQGNPDSKWYHPQRYKMLAGFVHVPAIYVETAYWLKLDTDVVAMGNDDWIAEEWFEDMPAIVCHRWGFTKPANQMLLLDDWVQKNSEQLHLLNQHPPLNIIPNPGWERVKHARIISWCGFFNTAMTRLAADFANRTVGKHQLPVPSQDGFLWYVSARMDHVIKRVNMKERGWEWWSTERNIRKSVMRAIGTKTLS